MRAIIMPALIAAVALSGAALAQDPPRKVGTFQTQGGPSVTVTYRQIGTQPPKRAEVKVTTRKIGVVPPYNGVRAVPAKPSFRGIGVAPPYVKARVGASGSFGAVKVAPPVNGTDGAVGDGAVGIGTKPPYGKSAAGAAAGFHGIGTVKPAIRNRVSGGFTSIGIAKPTGRAPVSGGFTSIGTVHVTGPVRVYGGYTAIGTQGVYPPLAGYATFGGGCLGSNGVPDLAPLPNQLPCPGVAFTLRASNLPLDPSKGAWGLLAANRQEPPLSLAFLGSPHCSLYVKDFVAVPLFKVYGQANWTVFIPNDPTLLGARFCQQVAAADEIQGHVLEDTFVMSNWAEGVIGVLP